MREVSIVFRGPREVCRRQGQFAGQARNAELIVVQAVDRQGYGADEGGSRAERAGADRHFTRKDSSHALLYALDKVRPDADAAAQDYQFRIDDRLERGDCERDRAGGRVERVAGRFVSGFEGVEDVANRVDRLGAGGAVTPHNSSRADFEFERAHGKRVGRDEVGSYRQIGDFAGRAGRAANELAVHDQAEADARAEGEKRCVPTVARAPLPGLAEHSEIDVVLDADLAPEEFREDLGDAEAGETLDVWHKRDRARNRIDDAGRSHHHASYSHRIDPFF